MAQEIIIPQVSVPGVDVLTEGGLYKVFVDMLTSLPVAIHSANFHPPSTALPQVFTNLAEISFRFPGAKINLIGDPLPANDTKTPKNVPTEKELKAAMKKAKMNYEEPTMEEKEAAKLRFQSPLEEDVGKSAQQYFGRTTTQIADVDLFEQRELLPACLTERECLFIFREKAILLQDKRRKGAKDYLNGIAYMILRMYPGLRQTLKNIVSQKDEESDNLF